MKEYDYTFVDNSDKVLQELAEKSDVILEAWGLEGERHAKELVRTDTGLLKNSITHAVAGESAAISSYRADNPDASGNINTGEYSGTTEKQGYEKAVYIGSNIDTSGSFKAIGSHAFFQCTNLTSLTINATTPPKIGTNILYGADNCIIYVPRNSVNTYKTASGWSSYADRITSI